MRDFTSQRFMDETTSNPFLEDLFVDHPANLPGVGSIHPAVFARVLEAVESLLQNREREAGPGLGRLFLVTAPEAGFGKTHLVARLRDHLGAIASTLVLPFDRSRPATWPVALSSTLRQYSALTRSRQQPISLLEEFSRYFLSRLVLENLASGAAKTRDCPEDVPRIQSEFVTLFSRESESKILAWVDKRAAELARSADPEFSRRLGMGPTELGFWTRLFVDFNLREESALDRLRGLSNGEARERLLQFLRLATDHRPAMLVADGLDGFHRSETAGMEIAEIVNTIREKVPRSVTLLCVNEDVWTSTFTPHLPSAWLDRLNGETLRLQSIGSEAARELVKLRLRQTKLDGTSSARFADRLSDDHRWNDGETPLSPRKALRQAGELWNREGKDFLAVPTEEDEFAAIAEEPLEHLTDKADFFAALQKDAETTGPRATVAETPPPLPHPVVVTQMPVPPVPEFTTIPRVRETDLAGIDSIINDIRGSGKTVVSESADDHRFGSESDLPATPPPIPAPLHTPAAAPSHTPTSAAAPVPAIPTRESAPVPASFFAGFTPASTPTPAKAAAPTRPSSPLTRASLEQTLAQRERELLAGPALVLDLDRLGRFIRSIGARHPALAQQEERYPSSRTVCLRWSARGRSVLTGFESPRNVYFWNNLLQQSLSSNRQEKIASFSHTSEPFEPSLFASFGFSPAVIRGRIDVIEMNDRELAMIYAADRTLRDHENSTESEKAVQLITLHLDPLWRRIIQAL